MASSEQRFEVPRPRARRLFTMADGARIEVRQHGNPAGRRLVLSHGNGFAMNAYYPFWRLLLADFEVLLYDQRNHGVNPLHGSPGHHFEGFVSDMDRLLDEIPGWLGPKPAIGMFHSVSAITALAHAVARGWRWERLVLFDPSLIPTPGHSLHEMAHTFELHLANWAMQRPDRFRDPGELAARLAETRSMQRWMEGAHPLVAESTLRRDEASGQWRLSCPRELEAQIYVTNAYSRVWDALPELAPWTGSMLCLACDPEVERAKYMAFVAQRLEPEFGIRSVCVSETTHMLQIERPEECARAVREFLDG